MAAVPPRLPPRPDRAPHFYAPPRRPSTPDADEPPPAYTPSPDHDSCTLQTGPRYPYGPPQDGLPPAPSLPQSWPSRPHAQPPSSGSYAPAPPQSCGTAASHSHPPWQPSPGLHPPASAFHEPTPFPTPGRPLMHEDRVLVYPTVNGAPYFCAKCCNTGFKGFDPSRPCRKCWEKYGKPWQVVRVSPMGGGATAQRPLPPVGSMPPPPPLVVRPGDPRIGGRLCLSCNGSGERAEEFSLANVFFGGGSEVCGSCRGTGRVFL